MNDVEEAAGAALPNAQPSPLEQEYTQVNENIRRLSEIRFRLLAFVPALGGVAVYVLATAGLEAKSAPPTNTDLYRSQGLVSRAHSGLYEPRSLFLGQNLMGVCSRLTAYFTRLAGLEGTRPSTTAWLSAVERTPCITPTVLGFRPSSILRALKARTCTAVSSRSRRRPKNGTR